MSARIEGLNDRGLARLLCKAVKDVGQSAWADSHGVSQQYVNEVVNFKTKPGPKIAKALGYRKKSVFVPLQDQPEKV